jgi:hypothetical protein
MAEWMASDLSKLELLVIQIDGLHVGNDLDDRFHESDSMLGVLAADSHFVAS